MGSDLDILSSINARTVTFALVLLTLSEVMNVNNLCSLLLTQVQLSICVQYCFDPWGAMVTAPLSIESMVKLLWLQTRVLPTTKITDLRVAASYRRLKRLLKDGFRRTQEQQFWQDVHARLGDGYGMTDAAVHDVAMGMGWEPQWMEKDVATKKRGPAARRQRQMEDDELRGSLEPFVRRPQPVEQPQQAAPQQVEQPNRAASVGAVPVLNTAGTGETRDVVPSSAKAAGGTQGVVPFPKPASLQLPGVVPRVNSAPEGPPAPRVVPKPSATLQSLGMALAAPPQQVPPQGLQPGGKPAPAVAPLQMAAAPKAQQVPAAGWQLAAPMPAPPMPGNMMAPVPQQAAQHVPAGGQLAPPMAAPAMPGNMMVPYLQQAAQYVPAGGQLAASMPAPMLGSMIQGMMAPCPQQAAPAGGQLAAPAMMPAPPIPGHLMQGKSAPPTPAHTVPVPGAASKASAVQPTAGARNMQPPEPAASHPQPPDGQQMQPAEPAGSQPPQPPDGGSQTAQQSPPAAEDQPELLMCMICQDFMYPHTEACFDSKQIIRCK